MIKIQVLVLHNIGLCVCTVYIYYVYIRGGTLHVILLNRHGMGIWVRCMTPYDKLQAIHPQSRRGHSQ